MRELVYLVILTSLAGRAYAVAGGVVDDGDPAVVALLVGDVPVCSGALVASRTILTAGHCTLADGVAFGLDASTPQQRIEAVSSQTHPQFTAEGAPYDFALLTLASSPEGITPLRIVEVALSDALVGATIRHVGYGVTREATHTGAGEKRTVDNPLDRIDAERLYSGAPGRQTCSGDSGGPGLMIIDGREVVVGVVSDGPDCDTTPDGWDGRLDLVRDWIRTHTEPRPPGCATAPGGRAPSCVALLLVVSFCLGTFVCARL